jgi:catechol 2,3-dioxygenase
MRWAGRQIFVLSGRHLEIRLEWALEDPDGNSVELLVDNFGNWNESSEFMRTSPEFAAKPMCTYVDPDKLVAARQAGMSFAELHQRAYAGEFPPSGPVDPRVLL